MSGGEFIQSSTQRVQRALADAGIASQVVEMPATTRTAKEAAAAIGCEIAQIVKSLIFRSRADEAVLVLASGVNRVSEARVGEAIGELIERATPEFVREKTGFAIGGVPPLGHTMKLRTLLDRDLLQYDTIWAAAGTPFAVFQITPHELQEITAALVLDVK